MGGRPADAGTSPPMVAVVVLNWNNYADSERCLDSVLESGYPALHPVLVDNASTDGSASRLRSRFPGIDFVQNERNLGFAAGCNRGISHALAVTRCRYVLLVNNDCRLAGGAIAQAVKEAESDPRIGLVTAKVLFDPVGRKIWHAGGTISRLFGRARSRGFGQSDRGQYDVAEDTGWATGALMLISRDVLERVGPLCEEYFFGLEEWDYSLAVMRAGYRIRYCPGFVGFHSGDGSHENFDPRYVYNYYRNKLIFQQRQLAPALFALWKLAFRLYVETRLERHSSSLSRSLGLSSGLREAATVKFAALCALEDHGRNRLSEATLIEFGDRLRARDAALRAASR